MNIGHFNTSAEAWERRLQSGQAGSNMMDELGKFDVPRQLALLGDWSDRIAKGELPKTDPARPVGQERNVVVTEWDWANEHIYLHDTISTDKRNPTVNANGLIYGAPEASSDIDPVARSDRQQVRPHQVRISRRQDADVEERDDPCSVAVLGQRADLGQPHQHPQSDVRR